MTSSLLGEFGSIRVTFSFATSDSNLVDDPTVGSDFASGSALVDGRMDEESRRGLRPGRCMIGRGRIVWMVGRAR